MMEPRKEDPDLAWLTINTLGTFGSFCSPEHSSVFKVFCVGTLTPSALLLFRGREGGLDVLMMTDKLIRKFTIIVRARS